MRFFNRLCTQENHRILIEATIHSLIILAFGFWSVPKVFYEAIKSVAGGMDWKTAGWIANIQFFPLRTIASTLIRGSFHYYWKWKDRR